MLDSKIEQGADYDVSNEFLLNFYPIDFFFSSHLFVCVQSNDETEIALEEARLNSLVQHWESASLSASMCSSTSRSLQSTPVRSAPLS